MDQVKLNLSRKWRSQNFQGIIGQDLTLKMLKNSLYMGHYFPVYLFAGQRGCGKTTTARVFASALNCAQLPPFQATPHAVSVPCGTCDSCSAMASHRHPDFIEIDAASHTGVDTIRGIIDAATLLPIMGGKKIYLIDEAHMLSKSAFNALLKILEEPPKHTLFILATTDQDKIIDTVRSRCFKLFFNAVNSDILTHLLQKVCDAESIGYALSGLSYIALHAQGSVRDALNILEQVRFATGGVQKASVLQVLGHVDDVCLLQLLQHTYRGNSKELIATWNLHTIDKVASDFLWRRLLCICRALVWHHHGVVSPDMHSMPLELSEEAQYIPVHFIQHIMEELYRTEQWFIRATLPQGLLEMVLLRVCFQQKGDLSHNHTNGEGVSHPVSSEKSSEFMQGGDVPLHTEKQHRSGTSASWSDVLARLTTSKDPHLYSILSQGIMSMHNDALIITFPAHLSFFSDIVSATKEVWYSAVQTVFGQNIVVETRFDGISGDHASMRPKTTTPTLSSQLVPKKAVVMAQPAQRSMAVNTEGIDFTDSTKWPKVNLILEYFPGTVTIAQEAQL